MRTGINSQLRACISPIYASRCSPFTSAVFFKHGMIIVAALLNMYPEDETSCTGLKEERMLQTTRPRNSLRRRVNMNRFRYFKTRACRGKNSHQSTTSNPSEKPSLLSTSWTRYFILIEYCIPPKICGGFSSSLVQVIQNSINIQYLVHDIT
jgi:hypothetical protein